MQYTQMNKYTSVQACLLGRKEYIQWNLRIRDSLGAELLSSFWRLSFGGRFESICKT